MKRFLVTLLIFVLLLSCCRASTTTQDIMEENTATHEEQTDSAPENTTYPFGAFSAHTLTDETVSEEIFAQADLTVVNLWATYCGPCKREMPTLAMLHEELENVQVLGIVLDCTDQNGEPDPDQVALAIDLAQEANVTYHNLILNMDLAMLGVANVTSVPATLFVDNQGNLVGQGFYGMLEEAEWRSVIAERLEMINQ